MRRIGIFIFTLTVGAISSPTLAETLTPLSEVMKGGPDRSYPLIRCAGFYQASTEWAGKKRVGSDFVASVDQIIKNLLTAAVLVRTEQGSGTTEHVARVVLRDTRNIADLYLTRFESNYASKGHAWSSDSLWVSDLGLCKAMAEQVQAK